MQSTTRPKLREKQAPYGFDVTVTKTLGHIDVGGFGPSPFVAAMLMIAESGETGEFSFTDLTHHHTVHVASDPIVAPNSDSEIPLP